MTRATLRPAQAAAFYAAYYAVLGILLPFLGPYLAGRGIGPAAIGWLVASFSLVRAVYAPAVGSLADSGRWRHGWLGLHLVLAAAAAAALPLHPGTAWAALCIIAFGCGHGAVLPLVEAHLLAGPLRRAYGPIRLWGSLAFIVVASGAGPLISRWPSLALPLITALLLIATAVASAPFEFRSTQPASMTGAVGFGGRVWLLLAVLSLHQMAHGPFYAMLSIDLERYGWSATAIGVTWSAGVAAETVLFAYGSRLTNRFRLETLLSIALFITPVRWMLFALEPSVLTVTAGHVGHAASFALAHLAGVQLVQAWAPEAAARRAQAMYSGLVFGLGIAAGSAAAGPLYALIGGRSLFVIAAGLSVLVAGAWWALQRKTTAEDGVSSHSS